MKYIEKLSIEPVNLSDWKSQSKMYQKKTAKWHKFSKGKDGREYKKDFTTDLIVEQGYICCYCEQKLNASDCHIEHLIPQSKDIYSKYLFEYKNLLCSCQLELLKGEPRHCGNSKENYIIPITPLMKNCESKFKYTEDGQIQYTDKDSNVTIQILNLDIDKLNKLRESAIDSILYLDPIEKDELLSEEESKLFAKDYLKIKDGKYNEFYTTIKYLFG